ncbi:MAG: hypothetical protein JWO25_2451 [Alphaproteobacteria bacterium]|nr:hypothetical protein [Alphaproteobacteria bacterium]
MNKIGPVSAAISIALALVGCDSADQNAATAQGPSTARRDQPGGGTALTDAKAHGEARALADMKSAERLQQSDVRNSADAPTNNASQRDPTP